MRKHIAKLPPLIAIFSLSFLVIWPCALFAGEMVDKSAALDISNIGFMENPPKELKEKFPTCDAFLEVAWIDKKKKIGYSHYEAIIKSKDGKLIGKKVVWALVDLEVFGIDYDVYQYKKQGRLSEIFSMVRNGEVRVGVPMMIDYMGKRVSLYGGKVVNDGELYPLLSNHLQTVCVAYPDELLVWIVEGKSVKQTFSEKQFDDLSRKIKQSTGAQLPVHFVNFWIVDVNSDGVADYFNRGALLYSQAGQYYWWKKESDRAGIKFSVPTNKLTCSLQHLGRYALTTDGKNFYFENQCNLTELTLFSEKE